MSPTIVSATVGKISTTTLYSDGMTIYVNNYGGLVVKNAKGKAIPLPSSFYNVLQQQEPPTTSSHGSRHSVTQQKRGEVQPKGDSYRPTYDSKRQPRHRKYDYNDGTRARRQHQEDRQRYRVGNQPTPSPLSKPAVDAPKPGDKNYSYITQNPAYSRRWEREKPAVAGNGVSALLFRYQPQPEPSKKVKKNRSGKKSRIDDNKNAMTKDKTVTTATSNKSPIHLPANSILIDKKRKRDDDESAAADYPSPPASGSDDRSKTKKARFEA